MYKVQFYCRAAGCDGRSNHPYIIHSRREVWTLRAPLLLMVRRRQRRKALDTITRRKDFVEWTRQRVNVITEQRQGCWEHCVLD